MIILYHLVKREENLFTQQQLGPSLISVPKGDEHQQMKEMNTKQLKIKEQVDCRVENTCPTPPSPPLRAETYASISAAVSVHQIQLTNKDTNMTIPYKYVQIKLQSKDSS